MSDSDPQSLQYRWKQQWPAALGLWGKFTRLSEPRWCLDADARVKEGLTRSFAMIRFPDHAIVLGVEEIVQYHLEDYALEILAHEIGHHILCPSDMTDNGRMIARMRKSLPTKESSAPFIGNIYADLLINDRLQRHSCLRMAEVYQHLNTEGEPTKLWKFYMRIYELLWRTGSKSLAKGAIPKVMEADAQLGARLIRSYARDWLDGSGRFAALCLPYLLDDEEQKILEGFAPILDGVNPTGGRNASPEGLSGIEDDEERGSMHPSDDPRLSGADEICEDEEEQQQNETGKRSRRRGAIMQEKAKAPPVENMDKIGSKGQYREPFEYGELLRALGLNLTDEEIAIRYYRERALPHLVRYPKLILPESTEPLAEGLEPWDVGSPLEDVDWLQSVLLSPSIIPGMTTVQRTYGTCEGSTPSERPIDLDLYVDCSGSMPNPQISTSYLALAAAIIALSALRVGARVQATLWSGADEFQKTDGFVTSEQEILGVVAGYFGGGTAFPIHVLRDTHLNRKRTDRAAHILVISDEGCDTLFATDERGNDGYSVAKQALKNARGGGSLVLNLYTDWHHNSFCVKAHDLGFDVFRVQDWEQLEAFSRAFSTRKYGQPGKVRAPVP